jgi:hypothetical protein
MSDEFSGEIHADGAMTHSAGACRPTRWHLPGPPSWPPGRTVT